MPTKTTPRRRASSTRSTTSPRSGPRARPARPFTVEHFRAYAAVAILDSGEPFELEDFQCEIAKDIFAGYPEVWLVIPEGNGKTTFLAELALYFGDYTPSAMIPIAASSREQAEIMYRQAEGLISRSPELQERFRAYDGYRRIKCHRTNGRIQVYAADDRTGDGIIPVGLALVDELHRHRDLKLYRTWRGKLDKTGAQIATISTAGDPGSEFEETRERIKREATQSKRRGCHVRAAGADLVLHDYAVPSADQAGDMKVVKAANPRSDITVEQLAKKRASPTMTREHWLRFVCNIATLADGAAIDPQEWHDLADPDLVIPDGAGVWVGLDLGWKWDTTAIVPVQVVADDDVRVGRSVIVTPPRDGTSTDEDDIVNPILEMAQRWNILGLVFDRNAGGQQLAQMLERKHGMRVIDHSQDPAPMAAASMRTAELVRAGVLSHPQDPTLTAHVLSAVMKRTTGEKWRFVKHRKPIDGAIALAMALSVGVGQGQRERPRFEVLA